jgi:hypothetical protein
MTDLPVQLVLFYFIIAGFFVGWAMPRGKYLKALQLRLLKGLHNFFADEEEYISHKVERIRKRTRSKK